MVGRSSSSRPPRPRPDLPLLLFESAAAAFLPSSPGKDGGINIASKMSLAAARITL